MMVQISYYGEISFSCQERNSTLMRVQFIITSLQPQGIHAVKYDGPKPDLEEIMNVSMLMSRMLLCLFVSTLLLWSFVVKLLLTMPRHLRHFVMNISNVNILRLKGMLLLVDIYNLSKSNRPFASGLNWQGNPVQHFYSHKIPEKKPMPGHGDNAIVTYVRFFWSDFFMRQFLHFGGDSVVNGVRWLPHRELILRSRSPKSWIIKF